MHGGGRLQPLLGRYEPSLKAHLSTALEGGWALSEAVSALQPRLLLEADLARFGEPTRLTFNVNNEEELSAAQRLLDAD